jgi:hypothetical protein
MIIDCLPSRGPIKIPGEHLVVQTFKVWRSLSEPSWDDVVVGRGGGYMRERRCALGRRDDRHCVNTANRARW